MPDDELQPLDDVEGPVADAEILEDVTEMDQFPDAANKDAGR